MCRWVAYFGNPIRPEMLLYDTEHSLVEQSRGDRLAGGNPNADGLGLGWYAARYASGPVVNSLFVTADASAVRALHPGDERFQQFSDEARAVVSEPLGDLPGLWHAVPAGTALVVQAGEDAAVPFAPRSPG